MISSVLYSVDSCECVTCFIGYSGVTTLTILRDERAEEWYLMLPELGRVLQELRKALPGVC